jgi:flagellar basal body P-ring formation protein FlgA
MTPFKKLLILLAVCSVPCMAAPCMAATTRGEVLLDSVNITLGDLFLNAGDKAGMIIAPAPAPGQKMAYDVTSLQQIARASGFEWKPESNYERTVITRDAQSVTSAMIKDLVVREMGKTVPSKDLDVTLDNQTIAIFRAKNEALKYQLTELKYDPIKNRFETNLVFEKANSNEADIIKVTGRAMPTIQVAILNHNVMR